VLWLIRRPPAAPEARPPESLECAVLLILMPLLSPLGWNYNYLYSWLAVMLIISVFSDLSPAWRVVQVANFAVIAMSLIEVWGRAVFHFYTQHALIIVNSMVVLITLFHLRMKKIA
jgi:hypothetical protein